MSDGGEESNELELTNSSSKKKRSANFSKDEVMCLIREYGHKLNLLNFGNRDQKQKCWDDITTEVNREHPDFVRTVSEIKKKWIDLLYSTKKEYVKATKEADKLGEKRRKLSDIAEMIVKVRGGFSSKSSKRAKSEPGMHVINLQIPSIGSDGESSEVRPTTFIIPNVEDCHSVEDGSDGDSRGQTTSQNNSTLMITGSDLQRSEAEVINAIGNYETYSDPVPTEGASHCACGLSADFVRLKQESLGIKRRLIQLEEERRLEEKQKWWEMKSVLRLKRQKLELEIKQMQNAQAALKQS